MIWTLLTVAVVGTVLGFFLGYVLLGSCSECSGYQFMCPQSDERTEFMGYPKTNQDIKQVIVIRRKFPDGNGGTFGIRAGKLIAQACHASMCFLSKRIQYGVPLTPVEEEWLQGSFKKVCLQVDTEEELLDVEGKATQAGLMCHLITDSGLTEFGGVPTKTCLAIGPDYSEKIDLVTKELKLY